MLRNIAVYTLLALSMMTAWADEAYPVIEFIKDGQVIESREMTREEYRSFMSLKTLETKIERLEGPLEEMEQTIELDVQAIEEEVAKIERTLSGMTFESLSDLSQLHVLGDIKFDKIDTMMENMQPLLDEVTAMSEEIGSTANNFKSSLLSDYSEDEIDQIRIKDSGDKIVLINRGETILNL